MLATRARMAASADTAQAYLDFNGTNTRVDCGSDVSLDDVMLAEVTLEAWVKFDSLAGDSRIFGKGDDGAGYRFSIPSSNGTFRLLGLSGGTNPNGSSAIGAVTADSTWHHLVGYYNDAGDRKPYLAIDGVWETAYQAQIAATGTLISDAATNFYFGGHADAYTPDGGIGWCRISDNDRYSHTSNFTPPARNAPPATDGNTVEQWNLDEGSGTTATAQVSTPTNDGAITNGSWGAE